MSERHIIIPGPVGGLEAIVADGTAPHAPVLLLCHPHPQYGGSMHDGVLDTTARALASRVRTSLRFNFRGVGASDGQFDGGAGETQDVVAAARYLTEQFPGVPLWLAGYSFGSAMVWRARNHIPAERIILIAPPIGMMTYERGSPSESTIVDVIYGEADDFVDAAALEAWATSLSTPRLHAIAGADHFFSGRHHELGAKLAEVR
jgi:alpha/beta superfamily hydrolase